MNKKDIVVAVHGNSELKGGAYNVLSTFTQGLLKGFQQTGVQAYTSNECNDKNIRFNMSIGFNCSGIDYWQKILSEDVFNIMWTVDSAFAANYKVIEQFSSFDKFILFEVTPADQEAVGTYIPALKHGYIPHATDLDLWKKTDVKKENDIVFFSSIVDYEEKIQELKETMPELVFNLMMEIRDISLKNPNLTFWQIYQILKTSIQLELDAEQYLLLFQNVSYICMFEQKVKMIQALSDFNVKVYGNDLWKKYIKGKVEYMGACDVIDSIDIMNKSKISLHCHPMQLGLGLHERILNASAVETFSLVSDSPSLKTEFGSSFGYFNHSTFEDIAQKADYFLTHEDERLQKVQEANKITKDRHTWVCRANSIMDIIS